MSVKVNVRITIVQLPLQFFVFMDATLTSIDNFQVRRHRCVESKLNYNIYRTVIHNFIYNII